MSGEPGSFTKKAIAAGVVLAGALALVGIYDGMRRLQEARTAAPASPLEALQRPVPEFACVDQEGRPVTPAALRGRVWVAGFIFTHCNGPCPIVTRRMKEIQDRLDGLGDARVVSFTIDPERDRPEVLKAYAAANGADPARWLFLTGETEAQLKAVREGFLTAVQAVEGSDQFIHGTRLAVVDRSGVIRGFYDGLAPDAPERVAARLRALHAE